MPYWKDEKGLISIPKYSSQEVRKGKKIKSLN